MQRAKRLRRPHLPNALALLFTAAAGALAGGGGCDGDPCSGARSGTSAGPWASCPPVEPPSSADDEACCAGAGWCLQSAILPAGQVAQLARDSCPATGEVCVPKDLTTPGFVPAKCRSLGDVEGRCLSDCLPVVAARGDSLPQSTCAPDNRCVPCYDPVSGGLTGACNLGPDDAPSEPKVVFASCCGGVGRCVPNAALTSAQKEQVGRDSCSGSTDGCIPQSMLRGDTPSTCRSVDDAEGRCLSNCLPTVAAQASRLPQATCQTDERCVPCFDPLTGDATGACTTTSGDHPAEQPTVFARCCDGVGRCVPRDEVAASAQAQLGRDSCSAAADLCVPENLLEAAVAPTSCAGVDGAEGRCLPACLPPVAAKLNQLLQASCLASERCVPCFDPITGDATGACTIASGDHPQRPATVLPSCCSGAGRCVPGDQLTDAQRSRLGRGSCTAATDSCIPQPMLDPAYVPPTCRSLGGGEGRCLSVCLPLVASPSAPLPSSSCSDGSLCAPCFDPVTGNSTGACDTSPADSPKEPPYRFPTCCSDGTSDRGTCVPSSEVPASQAANLGADTCTGDSLCAPTKKLVEASYSFPSCTVILGGARGACLPDCLPATQNLAGLLLSSSGCQPREKCVPCAEPATGKPTGACN